MWKIPIIFDEGGIGISSAWQDHGIWYENFSLKENRNGAFRIIKYLIANIGVIFSKVRFGLSMMMEPKRYSSKERCFTLQQVIPQL